MRYVIVLVLVALFAGLAGAQTKTAADRAAELRLQLLDVEAKQTELQARLKYLDEAMKPENIEHSLAGFGSTKPEELREQRRKELQIERNGVQAQLNLLNTSHTRLEAAIATADAEAYRQSAMPATNTTPTTPTVEPSEQKTVPVVRPRRTRRKRARRVRKTHHALIHTALPRA